MDGDGGEGSAQLRRSADSDAETDPNPNRDSSSAPNAPAEATAEFNLPTVLARLDAADVDEQRRAVRTIRAHVDDRPDACIPAVPKLRALLERPDLECREAVAYCLAELAEESAADVAPSADEIVSFAADRPSHPATADCCRCLAAIASERPAALVDRVDAIAPVLESDVPAARAAAALTLAWIAAEFDGWTRGTEGPDADGGDGDDSDDTGTDGRPNDPVEPVRDRLLALLEDDRARVRKRACLALGYGEVAAARDRLADLARTDPDPAVRDRAAWASDRLR
ncbi:HEAT repeat domain-containing protein [Halopiger thermotolerans]